MFMIVQIIKGMVFCVPLPSNDLTIRNAKGIKMVWNFFAIGHGKGEVDGARALLMWEVKKE